MKRLTQKTETGVDIVCHHYSEDERMCYGCPRHSKCTEDLLERLAYYEDLEEQGRLFIPPCAIGKTVWCISRAYKMVSQYTVAGYLHDGIRWKVRLTKTIPSWVGNKAEHKYVAVNAYNKTFFLTREEAEKALKEG